MRPIKFGRRLAVLAIVGILSAAGAVTAWAATRLATVQDVYWDDEDMTIARWEEVEDAYQYEVYLYRDQSRVDTFKTKKTYYNVEKKMTAAGEYTFKVRAIAKNKSKEYRDGYWSDESDSIYIDASFAELMKNGGVLDTKNSGPGANGEKSEPVKETSVVYKAEWVYSNEAGAWWYRNSDGTFPANGWWQDPATARWYFFNGQGYMMTGWIDWNGSRYYCLPTADTAAGMPAGSMVTGERTIDGVLYRFDGSGVLQAS